MVFIEPFQPDGALFKPPGVGTPTQYLHKELRRRTQGLDIRIAINLSQTCLLYSLGLYSQFKFLSISVLMQDFINKQLVLTQILKVCQNYKPVGLNIIISHQMKEGRILFEFESELTFQILHKNPLAYFNLAEILKFPNHISISLLHLRNLAK